MFSDSSSPHLHSTVKNLSLLAAVSVAIFASASVIRESYVLAILEVFGSVAFFSIWLDIKKSTDLRRWGEAFMLCVFIIMLGAMAAPDTDISVFGWVCVIPIASYSILGTGVGLAFTIFFEVLATALFSYRYHPVLDNVSVEAILNVAIYSIAIWVCSHIYESSREGSRRELFTAATQDSLTGLLNRARMQSVFDLESEKAVKNNSKLCLLMCDLDHFKSINDEYGHNAGDDVLVAVANSLREDFHKSSHIFRVGGEEFCLILPGTDLAQGVVIANQIRGNIEALSFCFDDISVLVTISVGVSQWGGQSSTLQTMLREADLHLYQAKARGRNIVVDTLDKVIPKLLT